MLAHGALVSISSLLCLFSWRTSSCCCWNNPCAAEADSKTLYCIGPCSFLCSRSYLYNSHLCFVPFVSAEREKIWQEQPTQRETQKGLLERARHFPGGRSRAVCVPHRILNFGDLSICACTLFEPIPLVLKESVLYRRINLPSPPLPTRARLTSECWPHKFVQVLTRTRSNRHPDRDDGKQLIPGIRQR